MLRNLLIYRIVLNNALLVAVVAWAAALGYVQEIIEKDTSRISEGIVVLFLMGTFSVITRARKVSAALNDLKAGRGITDIDPVKFLVKGEHIQDVCLWLVTLGLLGTVIGFVQALDAVDQNAMATAQGVQQGVGKLIAGLKVAIYTTLVGIVFGICLEVNRRTLHTATVCMLRDREKAQ